MGLIDKREGVLVAISGGADSVAMLHMLSTHGYYCVAAHCNFHLRGSESDSDEAFVRHFCEELGVPLHVIQFDTKRYAKEKKLSIEMAARELRYSWFEKLLDQLSLPVVAVAHHSDDSVETFMLNLVRGTGIRGLGGIKSRQGRIVRPLLPFSRQDIELYCRAHKLKYCTDSTNASDAYVRNKIRHNIIPVFKSINPSFLHAMNNNMSHLSQIYNIFTAQVEAFRKKAVVEIDDQTLISMQELEKLPEPEPYIFELLSPLGFSSDSIHKVSRAILTKHWGRLWFSSNYRAVVDRYNLIVQPRLEEQGTEVFDIEVGQEEIFTPIHLKLRYRDVGADYAISRDPMVAHFNAEKLEFPLTVRHWRQGDTFRPLGMKGFKKLSDFFVDNKWSRVDKESVWVLISGGEIAWIIGHRIDDRFKMTDKAKQAIEIKYTITKSTQDEQ
ncbi:MAG: tRNA lysidine(34) synthetase TilS [Marinilabiliaceae bacterium]|nr:tRNA lysidine(34) synthetase TilS [Marinilabiliaceae bacterium]